MALAAFATGSNAYYGNWVFDNNVLSTTKTNGRVYMGGEFTQVWANTGGGAYINNTTGMIMGKKKVLYINGTVITAAPDGSGGWYIGGNFTQVGPEIRNHIARINADGSLNAWNPNADNQVRSIVVKSNTVYVGGYFATIGGAARARIAALDVQTGAATAWDPGATNVVYCMFLSGTTLYVGGAFIGAASIGGADRNCIAALNTAGNGTTVPYVLGWDPDANGAVLAMALSGTTLYAAGLFNSVDSDSYTYIVALDTTATSAGNYSDPAWKPVPNSFVTSLAVSGTRLYVGGDFTQIDFALRNSLASFNTSDNSLNNWNPDADNAVHGLAYYGGVVYVAGSFSAIDGVGRQGFAAIDATASASTTYATAWDPRADMLDGLSVYATAEGVYCGGSMSGVNLFDRSGLACVDTTTGLLTSWDPEMTGTAVRAIQVSGNDVYVGGTFTSFNGGVNIRNNVAVLSADTGDAGLRFDVNNNVYALAVSDTTLYAGGSFTTAGYSPNVGLIDRLASFNREDGAVNDWAPTPNNTVFALALSGSTLYVGGDFAGDNSIGVTPVHRDYIAAIHTETGEATEWDPDADSPVFGMALNSGILYVGGAFTLIDGRSLGCVGALDTGTLTPGAMALDWNPAANALVNSISYYDGNLYVGGNFTIINGQSILYLAKLDTTVSGAVPIVDAAWNPAPSGPVYTVKAADGLVFAGGGFSYVGTFDGFHRMAAFDVDTALPCGY